MKVIRISDHHTLQQRWLYHLLEYFDTFTLLECRDRQSVCLRDTTNTVVLDHFDESKNPSAILNQVVNSSRSVDTLILVDSNPGFSVSDPLFETSELHMSLGIGAHSHSYQDFINVHDVESAVCMLKNRLTRAA